ncbi:hypothetical protein [Janthinobacterium sp. 17J80-10]|uniref:hypothetical protein n=1 Tax=Janthinobacterium sp. 17J80-10 TaxID=2497863 RepID=UPI0013E8E5AF|nr:hypothetical protein [Janthinobacterium sp. 17J80-10]
MKLHLTLLGPICLLAACGGNPDTPQNAASASGAPQQASLIASDTGAKSLRKESLWNVWKNWRVNRHTRHDHRDQPEVLPTPTDDPTSTRSITDRPDEINGPQIHVVYALPFGATDIRIDLGPVLENSTGAANNWLASQTGGRKLKFDTIGGRLDVTFVQLQRTDAEFDAFGVNKRDAIEADLANSGFLLPEKIYVVYYDGGNSRYCADAPHPPELQGQVIVMYLQGTPAGAPPCGSNPFSGNSLAAPGYWEFSLLHEIMHALGAVDADAPDYDNTHVNYDPRDLMYAGPDPWAPSILDVRKRNYYNPDGLPANVFNLANSSYLTN